MVLWFLFLWNNWNQQFFSFWTFFISETGGSLILIFFFQIPGTVGYQPESKNHHWTQVWRCINVLCHQMWHFTEECWNYCLLSWVSNQFVLIFSVTINWNSRWNWQLPLSGYICWYPCTTTIDSYITKCYIYIFESTRIMFFVKFSIAKIRRKFKKNRQISLHVSNRVAKNIEGCFTNFIFIFSF
jgi:hypothetical protein